MPDEVEVKVLVDDLRKLENKLRDAGFALKTPRTHELNTLYDFADQRLQKSGQLLRLRKYGSAWTLTHKTKGSTGIHKTRKETETKLSDGESLHQIFLALGLSPGFTYEKFRAEWTDSKGHVVLDETPIGNLAEIEGEPEWIDRTAGLLHIDKKAYITRNYAEMFREWKTRTGSKAKNMTFEECAKK